MKRTITTKKMLMKVMVQLCLMVIVVFFSLSEVMAQCSGPTCNSPSGNNYTFTTNNSTLCISASGAYGVNLNTRNNLSICIAPNIAGSVTVNLSYGNGGGATNVTINNYSNLTINGGVTLINNTIINNISSLGSTPATLTLNGNTSITNGAINNSGTGSQITINGGLTINNSNNVTNGIGSAIQIEGNFANNDGSTLTNNGSFSVAGNFTNNNNSSVVNSGSISITATVVGTNGNLSNNSTGSIDNSGSISIARDYIQTQTGSAPTLLVSGTMNIARNFTISQGSVQLSGGEIVVNGNYTQSGGTVSGTNNICSRFSVGGPLGAGISRISGGTFGNNTPIRMCDVNGTLPVLSSPTYPPGTNGGFNQFAGGTVNPSPSTYTTCPSCIQPLPITLIYFRAAYSEGQVNLNWATASEKDNDYFTIERSEDGATFTEVTQVKGAGNSSGLLTYQSVDTQPFEGVSYYRLKQTDLDGKYTYSNIRAVNAGTLSRSASVFPNPVVKDGYVQVAVNSEQTGDIYVTVYDRIGKQCFSAKYDDNSIPSIPVKDFSTHSGLYIIQARKGSSIIREKIIVQ